MKTKLFAVLFFLCLLVVSADAQISSGTARRIIRGTPLPPTCGASDVFFDTSDNSVNVCGPAGTWTALGAGGGGGAPTNATYITQTANGSLSAEQALSALASGIMRVATTTGVITALTDSAGIAANISDETGSSLLVFNTSPTLVTPILGVAAATSINKVTITAPATGATLTLIDGTTVTGPSATTTLPGLSLTNTFTAKQIITPAVNTNALAVSGYSLTGSDASSLFDLAGTWNTSGVPTLIKASVTNTASGSGSLLIDLQVGGSSKFSVSKGGAVTTPDVFTALGGNFTGSITVGPTATDLTLNSTGQITIGDLVNSYLRIDSDAQNIWHANPNAVIIDTTGVIELGDAPSGSVRIKLTPASDLMEFYNAAGAINFGDLATLGSGTAFSVDSANSKFTFTSGVVAIGTATPDASALVTMSSTTLGFLPPRVTTTQRDAISSPSEGLTVFNLTTHVPNYWTGSAWSAGGGGGVPGGSDTQLQRNNAGAFGGISGATTNGTAVTFTATNLIASDVTFSGGQLLSGATADLLEQRRGTNAQNLRVYNTYTSGSNYNAIIVEAGSNYGEIKLAGAGGSAFNTGNVFYITSPGNLQLRSNGGSQGWVISAGNVIAGSDNSFDIGASGASRPRSLFLGTNATVGGAILNTGITADTAQTDTAVCQDTTSHQFYSGTGTLGACLGTSTLRAKRNVASLDLGLNELMRLKPISFSYKSGWGYDPKKTYYGFGAEDVRPVLPNLTPLNAAGQPNSVDMMGMVPIAIRAIQEQQIEIENLKSRIKKLEARH